MAELQEQVAELPANVAEVGNWASSVQEALKRLDDVEDTLRTVNLMEGMKSAGQPFQKMISVTPELRASSSRSAGKDRSSVQETFLEKSLQDMISNVSDIHTQVETLSLRFEDLRPRFMKVSTELTQLKKQVNGQLKQTNNSYWGMSEDYRTELADRVDRVELSLRQLDEFLTGWEMPGNWLDIDESVSNVSQPSQERPRKRRVPTENTEPCSLCASWDHSLMYCPNRAVQPGSSVGYSKGVSVKPENILCKECGWTHNFHSCPAQLRRRIRVQFEPTATELESKRRCTRCGGYGHYLNSSLCPLSKFRPDPDDESGPGKGN